MFVKKLNLKIDTFIDKGMDYELQANNALKKIEKRGIKFSLIDLPKSYSLMLKDLNGKNRMMKLIKA